MAKAQINIQDSFLNQVRRENIPVTVFLVNGVQIKGYVRGFDNFTVVVESDGRQMMIYKHAMSTVAPAIPVSAGYPEGHRAARAGAGTAAR